MGRSGQKAGQVERPVRTLADKDPLGDRMKSQYENVTRHYLPKRTYTCIRIDGNNFSSYTRGLEKPFDAKLVQAMGETTRELCQQIAGCVLGYVQSDEISLLLTDFANENTEAWFGGNLSKIISISAAKTTAIFNSHFRHPSSTTIAVFDSRAFTIDDPVEVANMFLWRQQDAVRNAVSMIGQANFSPRELQGVSTRALRAKLAEERGIDVDSFPQELLRGQACFPDTVLKPVTFQHKRTKEWITTDPVERRIWTLAPAPEFSAQPGGWLRERIPTRNDS